MGGFFFGCAVCALGQVPVSSGAVSDRIAEVVEAFPCLKFRVRLVFRHRLLACPSLTDAISIFSRSKWWGSEILMYPLSIVSLIAEYEYATNRTRAQMRPAGTVFFTPPLRPPQNTSDVICEGRTSAKPVSKLERTGIIIEAGGGLLQIRNFG